jgi:hypothetical protein
MDRQPTAATWGGEQGGVFGFLEKDWRFLAADADRKSENRFIFFSGVVAWTTPFL